MLSEPLAFAPPRAFFEILPHSIFIAPYVGQTPIFWPFFRLFSTFGAYNFLTNQKLKKALGGAKHRLFLCRLVYAGDSQSVSSRWHFVTRKTVLLSIISLIIIWKS